MQDYIRAPEKFIQPDLFSVEDYVFSSLDFPLFLDTAIRWQFNENTYFLVSKDISFLLVSGFGARLSKKSERLIIKDFNKVVYEIPFFRLKNVAVLSKGVSLSSDLLEAFSKNNINLSFHDFSGRPYALLQSMHACQNVSLKRKQILAQNSQRGISLMKEIVCGKISNQNAVLKYAVKNLKPDDENSLNKISAVKKACAKNQTVYERCLSLSDYQTFDEGRYKLMGYEGSASRIYWKTISIILAQRISFEGRQHGLPQDAVNALLNYGYGILYSKIWSALIFAGLDPYAGFLHKEQTGKPSLVFDMIEEFRAPIVDRTVIAFIMLSRNVSISGGLLTLETREAFSEKILNRLTSSEYYKGAKAMINDILLMQAKCLADLSGEEEKWKK